MKANTILITTNHHPILQETCVQLGFETIIDEHFVLSANNIDYDKIIAIITSNSFPISAQVIDQFTNLQFIGRLGSGMEIIDYTYAKSKGIQCYSSPLGNANAVAEHCLGMLLNLINRITLSHKELINQSFLRKENMGRELNDLKVGLIGYGSNGKAFAQKLMLLGAQVCVYDIDPKQYDYHPNIHYCDELSDMFPMVDTLSLHIPIHAETLFFMDELIHKFHQPLILINCARGKLVSAKCLYENLQSGKLLGVCIDVWEEEPIVNMSVENLNYAELLINDPRVIATPHIAGYTHQAFFKMSKIIAHHLKRFKMNM